MLFAPSGTFPQDTFGDTFPPSREYSRGIGSPRWKESTEISMLFIYAFVLLVPVCMQEVSSQILS
ncbi:MAG TPA: hypothetical protein VE134_04565, partial [Methanomicrobiales archaeon]|nr:hypothetical protein [Methanomicrobiales archaeon]